MIVAGHCASRRENFRTGKFSLGGGYGPTLHDPKLDMTFLMRAGAEAHERQMNWMRLLLHAGTFTRLVRDGILRDHGVVSLCWLGTPPMDPRLISYLRPLRRRWGLTQRELALLIGAKTHSAISQIEALKGYPSLAGAIACSIIFDTPSLELFPELYTKVYAAVLDRADELYQDLQGNASRVTRAKLDFLEEVLARAHPHVRDMII